MDFASGAITMGVFGAEGFSHLVQLQTKLNDLNVISIMNSEFTLFWELLGFLFLRGIKRMRLSEPLVEPMNKGR